MCTHCSALWLLPPIKMVLILTARSSPQKHGICFLCSATVVARAGWGKLRHRRSPRPALACFAAMWLGRGAATCGSCGCSLILSRQSCILPQGRAANPASPLSPLANCSLRGLGERGWVLPHPALPCRYPNLGDGAASGLHGASTGDPSPQVSGDTKRHCNDEGGIKWVREVPLPLMGPFFWPTQKPHGWTSLSPGHIPYLPHRRW